MIDDNRQQDVDDRARELAALRQHQQNINTSIPCRVVRVNERDVDIELNVLRRFKGKEQKPLTVYKVPVAFPRSSTMGLMFPIKAGDFGLALFQQRDIDKWLNGETAAPDRNHLHDMQDAVYIPSLQPVTSSLPTTTVLKSGDMVIDLGTGDAGGKLTITNSSGQELISILVELVTILQATTTVPFVRHSSSTPTPELLTSAAPLAALLARLRTF